MVRIGRQIPHFEEVDAATVNAVFSEDRKYRYLLEADFRQTLYDRDRNRMAAVILKNPSSADERGADTTIRKVETYIYHRLQDVLRLSVLNLFALRATEPEDLNREYRMHGEATVVGPENDATLAEVSSRADYVLAAWGSHSGIDRELYLERIRKVRHILAGVPGHRIFQVRGARENIQPLHGMMWGYGYSLVPYQILTEEQEDDLG
jgi:hypothetical protein